MVIFSYDGNKVFVVNEGEFNGDYSIDFEGLISIININDGVIVDIVISIIFFVYNDK